MLMASKLEKGVHVRKLEANLGRIVHVRVALLLPRDLSDALEISCRLETGQHHH